MDREKIWELVREIVARLAGGWRVLVLERGGKVWTEVVTPPVHVRGAIVLYELPGLLDLYCELGAEELGVEVPEGLSPVEATTIYENELLEAYEELFLQGYFD